jgi:hypothetical protein
MKNIDLSRCNNLTQLMDSADAPPSRFCRHSARRGQNQSGASIPALRFAVQDLMATIT